MKEMQLTDYSIIALTYMKYLTTSIEDRREWKKSRLLSRVE